MNELTLYQNSKPYPYYAAAGLTTFKTLNVTPLQQNLKGGSVDLQLTLDDIFSFNYLSYVRNGRTVYAWVNDVEKLGGGLLYRVHFTVDAFRTFKDQLVLGTQFIQRSPLVTDKEDAYLSAPLDRHEITTYKESFSDPTSRIAVVQLRRPTAEQYSNVGMPTPYQFWVCKYSVNNWAATAAITSLLSVLSTNGESSNVVTIYSIPYIDASILAGTAPMNVKVGADNHVINGWSFIDQSADLKYKLQSKKYLILDDIPDLTLTDHTVSLIIPDAGIINLPDEVVFGDRPVLVRDIDLFSGACNYHIALENGDRMTPLSVRGSSLSTIPILSDPYDTYVSQNQNALAVSMIGDVANMAVGAAAIYTGAGAALGGSLVAQGAAGILNTVTAQADKKNMIPSNPPAYLGSALLSTQNDYVYTYITRKPFDNADSVHARYGYPLNRFGALTIPAAGYVQTQACSVSSTGSVPTWAIDEINKRFDDGILFS